MIGVTDNLSTISMWISNIADIIIILCAMIAAIYSIKTNVELRRERARLRGKVQIILKPTNGEKPYPLPVDITRNELSRAEVMGRLGMIPINDKKKLQVNQPRYALDYVNNEKFFSRIDGIKMGQGDAVLEIECSKEELEQFALDKQVPDRLPQPKRLK